MVEGTTEVLPTVRILPDSVDKVVLMIVEAGWTTVVVEVVEPKVAVITEISSVAPLDTVSPAMLLGAISTLVAVVVQTDTAVVMTVGDSAPEP